jgi:hypothetical protein
MSTFTISFTVTSVHGIFTWIPPTKTIEELEKLSEEDRENAIAAIEDRVQMAMRHSVGVVRAFAPST